MIETPSNPLNTMVDIPLVARIATKLQGRQRHRPIIVCDNTLLGPVFQRPLALGADMSVYSLTKYVGGHSDLIAGAALGSETLMNRSSCCAAPSAHNSTRIHAGCSVDRWRHSALRMERGNSNAKIVAEFLRDHPGVDKVHYLPFLPASAPQRRVMRSNAVRPGRPFIRHQGRACQRLSRASIVCRSSSLR